MAKVLLATSFSGVEIQVQGNGAKDAVANLHATLQGLSPAKANDDAQNNIPDEEAK